MKPRLLAVCGDLYVLSLDESDDEAAPAIVYRAGADRLSHVASLAGHLKMLNGHSSPFSGSAEDRERIEAEVAGVAGRR